MITAADAIIGWMAEVVAAIVGAGDSAWTAIAATIERALGQPPARGTWRWLESQPAYKARHPIAPDHIEINGEFVNLNPLTYSREPSGPWSASRADNLAAAQAWIDQGTSFYSEHTTRRDALAADVLAEAAASDARAAPDEVITVRCQYCGVGGQYPEAGVCGRCGGPFPEIPSRLGSSLTVASMPAGAPTTLTLDDSYMDLTRTASGEVIGATVWPAAPEYGEVVR